MPYDHDHHEAEHCPACEIGPFTRNAYWTGKLMLARDFIDEQRYGIEKLRHHNQHLHGFGIVCGLKVVQHPKEACRDRFVCVEPGSAVDCCGHDIVVRERDCIDLWEIPALKKLKEANDEKRHVLKICIRYKECESEPIPKLYDECGCDEETCAPNRVLESYELDVLVDPPQDPEKPPFPENCGDLWLTSVDGCPHCDVPDCLVLATIHGWRVGAPITDANIDNSTRTILPSVQLVKQVIDCILTHGAGGGGVGAPGKDGKGIDFVTVATGAPGTLATATLLEDTPVVGKRTLHLVIPRGDPGAPGGPGGPGLDNVELKIVPCGSPAVGQIVVVGGQRVLKLEIPTNCGAKFTHICTISWKHAGKISPTEELTVAFDGPINRDDINLHSFIVQRGEVDDRTGLTCWCHVDGKFKFEQLKVPCKLDEGFVNGAPKPNFVRFLTGGFRPNKFYRVIIKGDLIRDMDGKAVDINHLPPWVSNNKVTGDGIEGGTFESWFEIAG